METNKPDERFDEIKHEIYRIYSQDHYDGHIDRMAKCMAVLAEKYGNEVTETLKAVRDDLRGMITHYLTTAMRVLDTVKEKFGENEVNAALTEHMEQVQTVTGRAMSEGRVLSLDEMVAKFQWGEVVARMEDSAVVRSKGCLESHIAYKLGFGDALYYLYCSGDHKMVELMNPDYTCTFNTTYMQGGEHCDYNIYRK